MNKLDRVLEIMVEDLDAKQLWHAVFNKMTNPAKRQLMGELLNMYLGSGYSTQSSIFKQGEKEDGRRIKRSY